MATENNKNITYPTKKDLSKRQKIVLNTNTKNSLVTNVLNFINALKLKHS